MGKGQAVMDSPLVDSAPGAEISAGYKRTEVGVIPEDWKLGRLSDFGVFRSGDGFPLIYQGLLSGDYPFFKVSDMNNQGNDLSMETANHWISEDVRKKLGVTKHPVGGIVFAKIGAAIFLERKRLLSRESCIDNNMMTFSLTDHHACQQYFYYLFLHLELGKYVSTTALPSLSGRPIGAINIPIPPPDEQRAIAEVLSDVDRLIVSLESLITKKRAVKTAAMQQLLTGKIRLPGFSAEWQTMRLGEFCPLTERMSFVKGRGLSKADLSRDGPIPCIHYGELFSYGEHITDVLHGTDLEGDFVYSVHNDVLMPTSDVTPNGLATASCLQRTGVILGGGILAIRVSEDILDGVFLAYSIRHHRDQILQLVTGTTVYHLYDRDMVKFKFSVPTLEEQRAIAEVLSDMDAEIAMLEQRLDKIRAIKQGAMQQLLTGRIRLARPL